MAFVCTALDPKPVLVGDAIVVPIGYDNTEPKSYSLLIAFDTMAGGADEFFFCVIAANTADNTETRYWSGLETANFMTGSDRALVHRALIVGTDALLSHNSPKRVFCCTHDANLPERALNKHLSICHVFAARGYQVKQEPLVLGKHSWWMERRE